MNDTAQAEMVPGSDEYNQSMIDKFQNQGDGAVQGDQPDPVPLPPMPEGGYEKFYDQSTGQYNWENHAKELQYRLSQQQQPEQAVENQQTGEEAEQQAAVNDIISQAGLDPNVLRQQLEDEGQLAEDAMVALERVGLPRDIVETYVENLNFRREQTINEALDYVGGEQAWRDMVDWGLANLSEGEIEQYNNLLGTPEWRIAADAIRVRMGDAAPNRVAEPNLMSGQQQNGSTFGYRSKSEMKADMSDPRYAQDPSFRQEVMRKMQSATWDLDAQ